MTADFLAFLARAVSAPSLAMIAVLALRSPVRAAFGARVGYALWLIVPVVTLAAFLPARWIAVEVATSASSAEPTPLAVASPLQAPYFAPPIDLTPFAIAIWIAGFAVSMAMLVLDQRRLWSRLTKADAHLIGDVGPAVIGVVAPRIVIPTDFADRYSEAERTLVLEHERAHIRAGDVQVNAVAAFVQCVLWFNPLVYIARAALRVDQELACDERVMQRFGNARRVYAEAMLKAQLPARTVPLGCTWPALGAYALKKRIAMLGRPRIAPARRALGGMLCVSITLVTAAATWLAQPATPVYAADGHETDGAGARLVEALMQGDAAEALRQIEAGANVDYWSPGDGTPLILAARLDPEQAAAIAATLLRAGANVNLGVPGDGNPLIVASANGNLELMRVFVAGGANVNAVVRGDETPLINAAGRGRTEAVRYLVAHGADVNLAVDAPTRNGVERRSPLSMARRNGHDDIVALLTAVGARD